ncbi:MAG: STAS domain-containing protein [Solirubrobacteraceae bacterium]|nr:STAS domain-containing protein [Solirubrobacteraceae bacterium]
MPRADVPDADEDARVLVGVRDVDVVVCDVGGVDADLVTVEVLARLCLTARRLGCRLALRDASPELDELLAFCGLAGVLEAEGDAGR